LIPTRKDWQTPYFEGHYVPLSLVLVIAIPFFCMLLIATENWQQTIHERGILQAQLKEVLEETKNIHKRIDQLHKDIYEAELKLLKQYDDMSQSPPIWPPETLVAGEPSVKINNRRR